MSGSLEVGDQVLRAGDGAALSDEPRLALQAQQAAEVMLFDLA